MPAILLEGAPLVKRIKDRLVPMVKELKAKGVSLKVQAIQIGEDPSSALYVRQQAKAFQEIDIPYEIKQLPATSTKEEVVTAIRESNEDKNITGIILQTPLPAHLPQNELQFCITPQKDIEGVHPYNLGSIVYGNQMAAPCTALAALFVLLESKIPMRGKEAVIVGRSEIVGVPLALLLLKSLPAGDSPTVTVCHSATKDLIEHTKKADILIAAIGRANFVKVDMIKEGAVVIDIGTNRVTVLDSEGKPVLDDQGKPKRKTVGDVDFEGAFAKCSYLTPVPGGVGPVTVALLLQKAVFLPTGQKSAGN